MSTFSINSSPYSQPAQTILMDVMLTKVTPKFRAPMVRQTAPAAVDAGYQINQVSVVVGPLGYQVPATAKILYIETAYPISMQVGDSITRIGTEQGGVFALVGSHPTCVLVAESDVPVSIVYY
jgi:hypothetical protein